MKLCGRALKTHLIRLFSGALLCLCLCAVPAIPALAADPATVPVTHEDPDTARVTFSGLALLTYYSSALEPVLQRDPPAAQLALSIMPFANIPAALNDSNAGFSRSGEALAASLDDLFQLWETESELVSQFRFDDAAVTFDRIAAGLPEASRALAELRFAVDATAVYLKIDSLPPESELKRVMAEIQAKLDRLSALLDLLKKPLFDPRGASGQPALLTLEIASPEAFVGDSITFRGSLTSAGGPLAGREIDILVDDSRVAGALTGSSGAFEGELTLPYLYQPEVRIQAVYYPRDADIDRFLGSSSSPFNLRLLYYSALLTVTPEGGAYPGRDVVLKGVFDYAAAPPVDRPAARLSLDDSLVSQFVAAPRFDLSLAVPSGLNPGFHTLTFFVPAAGRYAPVSTGAVLEVTLAPIHLDYDLPAIAFTPGGFNLSGRAYSDLGPLSEATLEVRLGNRVISSLEVADGLFSAPLRISPGFSLLGAQTLDFQIQPREPWNAPLTHTVSLFVINWLACGVLLLLVLAAALVFSRGLRKWSLNRSIRVPALTRTSPADLDPVYSAELAAPSTKNARSREKPPDSIPGLYRAALIMIQKLTGAALKPQQTLREFARQNSRALGPLGPPFMEFTLLIERLLYSKHPAGPDDMAHARQLSKNIRNEEASNEDL